MTVLNAKLKTTAPNGDGVTKTLKNACTSRGQNWNLDKYHCDEGKNTWGPNKCHRNEDCFGDRLCGGDLYCHNPGETFVCLNCRF